MRSVSVMGIGETKMGKLPGQSLRDLIQEAGTKATKDAKVEKNQIQALYIGNFNASQLVNQSQLVLATPVIH